MSSPAAWIALLVAGLLDVAWVVTVKQADGYTRLGWTLLSLVLLAAFIASLGKAMQVLPVGTAYAVWTGIGAAGSAFMGSFFLESRPMPFASPAWQSSSLALPC